MTIQQYLQHRLRYEALFALCVASLIAVVNATSNIMDSQRNLESTPSWIPWALELTSAFAVLMCIPLLTWFVNRLNLSWNNLRWQVTWHIPAFITFTALHVGIFVVMRKAVFGFMDSRYVWNDPIWFELLYELRKDLLTYLGIVIILSAYNFILTRLQGEASFLVESPEANATPAEPTQHYPEQFLVKMLQQEYLVQVQDIHWLEAAGNYIILHCADRNYPMRQTLSGIMAKLNPAQFQRTHRSALVNFQYVHTAELSGDNRHLVLESGVEIAVSKTYLPSIRERLKPEA